MVYARPKRVAAELLGTALLLATVVGSGIMAERMAGGNAALALMGNTLATGAILFVLITILGPISGAHFNPVVSLVSMLSRRLEVREFAWYLLAQLVGAGLGVLLAHLMFELPLLQASTKVRAGSAQTASEFVATFGLLLTILCGAQFRPGSIAALVACYISAAYWFTASTSFANPIVTIARSWSDTFAGIRPADVPLFVGAQIAGALAALAFFRWIFEAAPPPTSGTSREN